MKKQFLSIALGLVALLSVTASFAASNNVSSIKDGKRYQVGTNTVEVDGAKTSVFTKNGSLVYSVERFTADALPKDIFDIVRDGYDSYYISGMEKVEQPGLAPVYFVHLQDKTTIKTVKVNASTGEKELVQDFTRG
jgi:hypothetical protein